MGESSFRSEPSLTEDKSVLDVVFNCVVNRLQSRSSQWQTNLNPLLMCDATYGITLPVVKLDFSGSVTLAVFKDSLLRWQHRAVEKQADIDAEDRLGVESSEQGEMVAPESSVK